MGNVSHKLDVYTECGKPVALRANSRKVMRILGSDCAMSGQNLNILLKGEVVRIKKHFVCDSSYPCKITEAVESLKAAKLERYRLKLSTTASKIIGQTVVKLDEDGNHLLTYFMCTLEDVADDLNLPIGTVKSKIHRDLKIIKRRLDGEDISTSFDYRLVYLEDLMVL